MATKTKTKSTFKKSRNVVMDSVKNIHNQVIETTEDFIEVSVVTGEKYQKIAAKAIKKSEPLITKQVDIVFDTLEELYDQYEHGTKRILNLLGIKDQVKLAKNVGKSVVKAAQKRFGKNVVSFATTTKGAAADTIKKVSKKKVKATKKAKAAAKKIKKSSMAKSTAKTVKAKATKISKASKVAAKKVSNATAAKSKKAAAKATKAKTTAKVSKPKVKSTRTKAASKRTATRAKAAPKRTARKTTAKRTTVAAKRTVSPSVVVAQSLQKINGVGPKMEGMLNAVGVYTYSDLAAHNKKSLTAAIEAIYPSARLTNLSKWIQSAKRLSK